MSHTTQNLAAALAAAHTQHGDSLAELSARQPLLVALLRHAGCTFCREAVGELAEHRAEIEAAGARIVLVHLSDDASAAAMFARFGLPDVDRVADPERRLYRAFELPRGRWWQVLGPTVWWRGLKTAIFDRYGFGGIQGDVWQLPGVFLVDHGKIIRGYRHQTSADRPDYVALAECKVS